MLGHDTWGILTGRQRIALMVATGVMLLVAVAAMTVQRAQEESRAAEALMAQGQDIASQVEHELDIHRLVLTSLGAFFVGSEEVTRLEFHRFTRSLFREYPGIRLLGWAPMVLPSEVQALERMAASQGVTRFRVQPGASQANPPLEAQRPLAPLFYVEPEDYSGLLGRDMGALDTLGEAMARARDSGAQVVAPCFLERSQHEGHHSFVVLFPVFRAGADTTTRALRRQSLLGFLIGDAHPQTLLLRAIHRYRPRAVDVHLFESEEGPAVAHHLSAPEGTVKAGRRTLGALKQGLHFARTVHETGHRWTVVVTPSAQFAAFHQTLLPWLTFGSVVLLGLLAVLYVASLLAATTRARRTAADLARSKAELEREITERARAEEDRARLATAIEQAGESFIVTDLDGRVQYVNPAFERASGYDRQEMLGQSIMTLAAESRDEGQHREVFDTLARGEIWSGRFLNQKKDGTPYQEEATIAPVSDREGRIVAYVSVQRDITEKLRLEARMRQIHKMEAMGTLAGGIAHDFNNILTAILGHAELAALDTPPGSPVQSNLEEIRRAAERAATLVAQILAFTRQTREERRPTDIRPVVAEALRLLRGSLPPTVEIHQSLAPQVPPVVAEPGEIHQVILNLGSNAFHAMRERGGVLMVILEEVVIAPAEAETIDALSPGRYVRLVVSDTGHGIDPGIQERIFEPYFTTKGRGEGTGMGLSTVHGIVRNMGGAIQVESALGSSATFTILFPVAPGQVTERTEIQEPPCTPRGTERILLVDDEAQITRYLSTALSRMGYRVTTCADGEAALAIFREAPDAYDVVITDQMMPRLTGTELTKAIHATRPELPVLLCTGFGESLPTPPDRSLPVVEVISKPVKAETLASAIRRRMAARAIGTG